MDNAIKKEMVRTEISGKLMGHDVTTIYESTGGTAPELVRVVCNIVQETARIDINISCTRDEVWNIASNMTGRKSMAKILQLISAMEKEVTEVLATTA